MEEHCHPWTRRGRESNPVIVERVKGMIHRLIRRGSKEPEIQVSEQDRADLEHARRRVETLETKCERRREPREPGSAQYLHHRA
jgi:hypothetical protein